MTEHGHRQHEQPHGVNQPETGTGTRAFPLSQSTGTHDNTTGTQGSSGHHYGRDAAVGAGGIGLAEHEHRKHEGTSGTTGKRTVSYASSLFKSPSSHGLKDFVCHNANY